MERKKEGEGRDDEKKKKKEREGNVKDEKGRVWKMKSEEFESCVEFLGKTVSNDLMLKGRKFER